MPPPGPLRLAAAALALLLCSLLLGLLLLAADPSRAPGAQCPAPTVSLDGATVTGSACAEEIVVTSPDVETVNAGGGNDLIYVNPEVTLVYGGEGDDAIYGELPQTETALPEAEVPQFIIAPGRTRRPVVRRIRHRGAVATASTACPNPPQSCYGGLGNQALYGNSGDDKIFGERGNDNLSATQAPMPSTAGSATTVPFRSTPAPRACSETTATICSPAAWGPTTSTETPTTTSCAATAPATRSPAAPTPTRSASQPRSHRGSLGR